MSTPDGRMSPSVARGWGGVGSERDGTLPTLAILASGRGSHFATLADAVARGDLSARIGVLITDVADAPVLERARERGSATAFVDPAAAVGEDGRYSRELYGQLLVDALTKFDADYVVLAGFMRLLGGSVLERFAGRIVNIHPSLLPAFPGLDAQRQAWQAGVKVSGCTVHLVDAGMDTGPILAQRAVPVHDDDTAETLAERILAVEHELYGPTLQRLLTGRMRMDGRRVTVETIGPRRVGSVTEREGSTRRRTEVDGFKGGGGL